MLSSNSRILYLVLVISERGGWTVKSKATAAKASHQRAAVLHYVFGKLLNFVINVYDGEGVGHFGVKL